MIVKYPFSNFYSITCAPNFILNLGLFFLLFLLMTLNEIKMKEYKGKQKKRTHKNLLEKGSPTKYNIA